jgi:hypothetical protein
MRRNKLYIILSTITILALFITAATCSFCGIQPGAASSNETKIGVKEDITETISENTNKETSQDTDAARSDQEDSDKETPAISLEISEGPFYSAADDVCYWRVKANVTGSPTPKITWSTDYSNGTLGKDIAQVNLTRDNPNYTLTATATNSEGTAKDDIALSWGCDSEETEAGSEESIATAESTGREITIQADRALSGYIIDGEHILPTICAAGDYSTNKQVKGYLSFDISELEGIDVFGAELRMDNVSVDGNPAAISPSLNFKVYDYGDSLDFGDFAVGGTNIHTFNISSVETGDNLVLNNNDALINTLQGAIDNGRHWYQLKFGLLETVSNNNESDVIGFLFSTAKLKLNYSE